MIVKEMPSMPHNTRAAQSRGLVLLALSLLAASPLLAGVRLEYGSQVGDSSTYRLVMDGQTTVFVSERTQKTTIRTEMSLSQEVTGYKDGIVSLESKIDSGSINVNGQQSALPSIGQVIVTRLKKNGEILSASGFGPNMNLNSMQLVFPDRELDVGDSWKSTIDPTAQVPVPLHVEYKVLGFEKIRDYDCIKIASSVRSGAKGTVEGLDLKVQADGNIYYAYKVGKMIKNDVTSVMNMVLKRIVDNKPQRIITKMNMDMRMELQF